MTQSHVTNSKVLMFIINCDQYDQHKHWNPFAIQNVYLLPQIINCQYQKL